jgi:diadenosine tetraphosphate (Ap4A) HIT family hydrolase
LSDCPFCLFSPERLWIDAEHAVAVPDAYPISDGHTLVVTRRHVNSLYELSDTERNGVWELVSEVRQRMLTKLKPDGFNIGVNDGLAAGQ